MIAVGEHKAKIFHGDTHPAELYIGNKKIAGFNKTQLTGSGRVGWDAPYKAAIPDVKVFGKGYQRQLSGKNLAKVVTGKKVIEYGITYEVLNDNSIHIFGTFKADRVDGIVTNLKLPPGTYTTSHDGHNTSKQYVFYVYSVDGISHWDCGTFTIPENGKGLYWYLPIIGNIGEEIDIIVHAQIEKGSVATK